MNELEHLIECSIMEELPDMSRVRYDDVFRIENGNYGALRLYLEVRANKKFIGKEEFYFISEDGVVRLREHDGDLSVKGIEDEIILNLKEIARRKWNIR